MDIIRVIDFETAGDEPPAPVIEVGWCDVVLDGTTSTIGLTDSFL